jgi:hypothetical protein
MVESPGSRSIKCPDGVAVDPDRTNVVAAPARTLHLEHGRLSRIVSVRPERQGCPRASALCGSALRASALRGPDSGLASTGELLRQPRAALARRATVAVFLQHEVAVDRASIANALEAHRKEDSHEPCCHRSNRRTPLLLASRNRSNPGSRCALVLLGSSAYVYRTHDRVRSDAQLETR